MIKIYYMQTGKGYSEQWMAEALNHVDPLRRVHVGRQKVSEERIRSVAAGLLLQYGVKKWEEERDELSLWESMNNSIVAPIELNGEDILCYLKGNSCYLVEREGLGKPFLPEYPQLNFSLSHSGEYAICAIADCLIGIDLQQHMNRGSKEKLAKRFFSESEQKEDFYRIWTAKEAYAKFTGLGLAKVMEAMETVDLSKGCIQRKQTGEVIASLQEYFFLSHYSICLCYPHFS